MGGTGTDEDRDFRISPASAEDAEEILAVVHAAFRPVAEEYGEPTLPPLEETLEDLREEIGTHVVLKACDADGRILGSVRGVMRDGTCEVGRLVVLPETQGRGLGKALAIELEERFPSAERFELFTGHHRGASMHIYESLGYVPFRVDEVTCNLRLVYMEKRREAEKGYTGAG